MVPRDLFVALLVSVYPRINLFAIIFKGTYLDLTLFCLSVGLGFDSVDKDTNPVKIVCKSEEVVKTFRITRIDAPHVVDGKSITRPVQISLPFPSNFEIKMSQPMLRLSQRFDRVDESFGVGDFWCQNCLVFQENGTIVRFPVHKVFLEHWKEQVLIFERRKRGIRILSLLKGRIC